MLIQATKKQEYSKLREENKDNYTARVLSIAEDWTDRIEAVINEACGGRLYESDFNKWYPFKHYPARSLSYDEIIEKCAHQEYVNVRRRCGEEINLQMYLNIVQIISEVWEFGREFEIWIERHWDRCNFCKCKNTSPTWPWVFGEGEGTLTCRNVSGYRVRPNAISFMASEMRLDKREVHWLISYFGKTRCR